MAGRPKYTPKLLIKKRRGINRERIVLSVPEDYALAVKLHGDWMEERVGKRVSPSDAILNILDRSRTVQDLLPQARATIKAKQEQSDEREGRSDAA